MLKAQKISVSLSILTTCIHVKGGLGEKPCIAGRYSSRVKALNRNLNFIFF